MTPRRENAPRVLPDLNFLSRLTRETLSSLQLGTLLRKVSEFLRDTLGCEAAAVGLREEDELVFLAGSGVGLEDRLEDKHHPPRIPLGRGLAGLAAQQGKTMRTGDVPRDPDARDGLLAERTRSQLVVPLLLREEVIGVLDVQGEDESLFDDSDAELLEIVGALVAPAIHVAALYERERRRSHHLRLAGEIAQIAISTLDEESVVAAACDAILEALDVTFVGIALFDEMTQKIRHGGHASLVPLLPSPGLEAELGHGVVGRVIESGSPLRIDDVATFEDFHHIVPGMGSALCVPLRSRERIIGALEIEHPERSHFSDEDEELLHQIAAHLAQAVENATLFEDQRRRWQQLLVIHEATRIATQPLDLDEILAMLAREVHDRFGHFAVAVLLVEDRELVVRALHSDERLDLGLGHKERIGDGLAGRVAETGEVLVSGEGSLLRADTRSVLGVPLRAHGGVFGVILVESLEPSAFGAEEQVVLETLARSVTGAIANARLLRQTEQLREDLNRMIVHDLRNPVQALLLTLQEVHGQAEGKLEASVLEAVTDGIHVSEDLLEMVSSLLDVSRFEAGKATLRSAAGILNDHIRAVVRRFASAARAKRIQVTTVLSPEVPVLRFDHELLGRTLANLVGNAMKFTPEGGRVTVRSELTNAARPPKQSLRSVVVPAELAVAVMVEDTGEGIPLEYQDKIFEKFGQVESRKAGLQMSTGLGLALCRYVVEAHGGTIWVESSPGQGATFCFTLPLRGR